MRKQGKQLALEIVQILHQTHEKIKKAIENREIAYAQNLLTECQQGMIQLGNSIEETEGEGFVTVGYIEEYCERVYQYFEELEKEQNGNANKIYKVLRKYLIQIESSIKNDIPVKLEMVFLPYKASMWDSLESVWKAADADENCDAYVIPIPYYDKNPDGSFKQEHWEGNQYPSDVPITRFEQYDFEKRKPDAIFIHNPYDDWNTVTSVHPFFFSKNLKQFTDCLVYIPYFASSGGMSEGQALLPSYIHADYIVIQSEKYRKYYDPRIPDKKFLAFGSPKFDSVIHKCQNPPEPPEEWKEKMQGKKVYFYNTSIAGMLEHTENFLKKMEYVFNTFKGREDVCLLWRPHPLLESTFERMRKPYKPVYEALKKRFVEENLGILDTTPDIEGTIALCDAYIGDAGSSVTSLFGVVGKPMFILNNNIHALPQEDDWRGEMFQVPFQTQEGVEHIKYYVSYNNKLYYSPNDDMHYKYFCDLAEYSGGGYYNNRAFDYEDKIYVFPNNAQHILVITCDKKIRKIELKQEVERAGAFGGFWIYGEYAFLRPNRYSALVRFNMKTEEIMYLSNVGRFNIAEIGMERISAAMWIWKNKVYFINPKGTQALCVDMDTFETSIMPMQINRLVVGTRIKEKDGNSFWLIPYEGTVITSWNIITGETKEYDLRVDGLQAWNRRNKVEDNKLIFGNVAFMDEEIIVSPNWGNKFVKLNPTTGEVEEWVSPFKISLEDVSPYKQNFGIGGFMYKMDNGAKYSFALSSERKLYEIDLHTKEINEIEMHFEKEEVYSHVNGYGKESQWLRYCCIENVFNSITDELDGNIHGEAFERERQIKEYTQINTSPNGDCGKKVYRFITESFK